MEVVPTLHLVFFLGPLHPLLVHLPIGGLVLLGFLESVAAATRWKNAAESSRWILRFVAAAAIAAAACGWLLGRTGGFDLPLLKWHRVLGVALCGACLLTLWLRERESVVGYRASLAASLVLLGAVGHLGGTITHGSGFLTEHAPALLRPVLAAGSLRPSAVMGGDEQPVFAAVIEPILQKRCVACHGPEKHKADLRLDSFGGLVRGGVDGSVLQMTEAKTNVLLERILSPAGADGHMPPEGSAQLTLDEAKLLEWWVKAGAPAEGRLRDLDMDPAIRRLLQLVSKGVDSSR